MIWRLFKIVSNHDQQQTVNCYAKLIARKNLYQSQTKIYLFLKKTCIQIYLSNRF